FFIASFALWGVWVGMGLATLMEWISEALELRVPDGTRRWTLATPVLLLALIPLWGNHLTASRKGETLARDLAFGVLHSVQPYGGVAVTLDPQQLGRQYLERADVIVLEAIKDQVGKRPIYYSRTVGPYADQFGLTGYLEGQGFARKLRQQQLAESDSLKLLSVF